MLFFVKYGHGQEGPYELVSVIRKIRNHEISPDTLIMSEEEPEAVAASEHPRLKTFFDEMVVEELEESLDPYFARDGLAFGLQRSWKTFQLYPNSAAYSGAYIGIVLFVMLLVKSTLGGLAAIFAGLFLLHFLSIGFLKAISMLHDGERFQLRALAELYKPHAKTYLIYSLLMAIISLFGGMMLVIPALIALGFLLFAPLILLEGNLTPIDAMKRSIATIRLHGRKMFELVFAITVINFIGGLFFLLPLTITLPVTGFMLVDMYRRL
jgi:hypothetical protein